MLPATPGENTVTMAAKSVASSKGAGKDTSKSAGMGAAGAAGKSAAGKSAAGKSAAGKSAAGKSAAGKGTSQSDEAGAAGAPVTPYRPGQLTKVPNPSDGKACLPAAISRTAAGRARHIASETVDKESEQLLGGVFDPLAMLGAFKIVLPPMPKGSQERANFLELSQGIQVGLTVPDVQTDSPRFTHVEVETLVRCYNEVKFQPAISFITKMENVKTGKKVSITITNPARTQDLTRVIGATLNVDYAALLKDPRVAGKWLLKVLVLVPFNEPAGTSSPMELRFVFGPTRTGITDELS